VEDWGQLVRFEPGLVLQPASLDELKDMLERVHRGELGGGTVRVPGSLHSCSDIVATEDTLLDIGELPASTTFEDGDEAVVVTANTTLHDFLKNLAERGRSSTATGGVDHQTLAGLLSTGTAPATANHGMWDVVDWVEFLRVDAQGQTTERRITRGDDEFGAVVCSLGLLGVMTRLRVRTVEERYFDTVFEAIGLDDVLQDLDATCTKYDFWRINWLPRSNKALLWAATRTSKDKSKPEGDYPTDFAEHALDRVYQVLDKIAGAGPLLNKPMELLYDGMALVYSDRHYTGPLRTMIPVDRRAPLHVAMAEWSFRPDDIYRVLGECEQYFDQAGWPNIPTGIEATKTDGSLMSHCGWPDLDYVVKFNFMWLTEVCTTPQEKDALVHHARGLWDHLARARIPFKAHWGKVNFIDPAFVQERHRIDAFRPLVDPMFLNPYLMERLGGGP
jgi:FAD/FMN-containing dehydrogenase